MLSAPYQSQNSEEQAAEDSLVRPEQPSTPRLSRAAGAAHSKAARQRPAAAVHPACLTCPLHVPRSAPGA